MKKILAFDLDDTLAERGEDLTDNPDKYLECKPIDQNIQILNKYKALGHKIIIYTSRGMTYFQGNVALIERYIRPLTEDQLKQWGVMYDELIFGKLHYDVFIDDKALNALNPYLDIAIDNKLNKRI